MDNELWTCYKYLRVCYQSHDYVRAMFPIVTPNLETYSRLLLLNLRNPVSDSSLNVGSVCVLNCNKSMALFSRLCTLWELLCRER